MPTGSCRSIFGQSHGRCQPLHHTCETGDNYAQRNSVSLLDPGRASTVLKLLLTGKPVDCRLCGVFVYFPVQGKGTKVGEIC